MLVAQIRTVLLQVGVAHLKAVEEAEVVEVLEVVVAEEHSLRAAQRAGLVKHGVLAMLMV
jgi:hypothetical protein